MRRTSRPTPLAPLTRLAITATQDALAVADGEIATDQMLAISAPTHYASAEVLSVSISRANSVPVSHRCSNCFSTLLG